MSLFAMLVISAVALREQPGSGTKSLSVLASAVPVYDDDGSLRWPEGFRTWVFVGASLGLSYSPHKAEYGDELFHNVYLDRRAYEHYARTGEFPEKSMLAMSVYRQANKSESLSKLQGSFEGELVSLEVAVKDSERFDEGWAYFDFSGGDSQKETARPFAREKCFECHAEHAADDNVFVQYYPILRRLKAVKQDAGGAISNSPTSIRSSELPLGANNWAFCCDWSSRSCRQWRQFDMLHSIDRGSGLAENITPCDPPHHRRPSSPQLVTVMVSVSGFATVFHPSEFTCGY